MEYFPEEFVSAEQQKSCAFALVVVVVAFLCLFTISNRESSPPHPTCLPAVERSRTYLTLSVHNQLDREWREKWHLGRRRSQCILKYMILYAPEFQQRRMAFELCQCGFVVGKNAGLICVAFSEFLWKPLSKNFGTFLLLLFDLVGIQLTSSGESFPGQGILRDQDKLQN